MAPQELNRIAVTGGNGFIASHIILQLLECESREYRVTTTVRTQAKGAAICDLPHASAGRLSIVEVPNLADAEAYSFFAGLDAVLHLASPVTLATANPQTDIVDPAVNGTLAVLRAAKQARTVKVVIVTSCLGAVADGPLFGETIDETMWNYKSTVKRQPLFYSKACAEKAAWQFMDDNKDATFKLITLIPAMTIGPSLTKSVNLSVRLIQEVANGSFPFRVGLPWPFVDVRDVAAVHIAMLENSDSVESGRFLVANEHTTSMVEVSNWISKTHLELTKVPVKSISRNLA
ncbi:hypothetical protein HDU82_003707 [Entophlyctis luteolus]|nr:hypothetical protein HDU82_003707 [Entophlyctis luteolus]